MILHYCSMKKLTPHNTPTVFTWHFKNWNKGQYLELGRKSGLENRRHTSTIGLCCTSLLISVFSAPIYLADRKEAAGFEGKNIRRENCNKLSTENKRGGGCWSEFRELKNAVVKMQICRCPTWLLLILINFRQFVQQVDYYCCILSPLCDTDVEIGMPGALSPKHVVSPSAQTFLK